MLPPACPLVEDSWTWRAKHLWTTQASFSPLQGLAGLIWWITCPGLPSLLLHLLAPNGIKTHSQPSFPISFGIFRHRAVIGQNRVWVPKFDNLMGSLCLRTELNHIKDMIMLLLWTMLAYQDTINGMMLKVSVFSRWTGPSWQSTLVLWSWSSGPLSLWKMWFCLGPAR